MGLLLLASLLLMPAERCQGYIIPAEQLIAFMAKNFSKFQTVIFIQSVQQEDESGEAGEEYFMEKIWMKSPDLFHAEILDHSMGRRIEPDSAYRQLCIANSGERLMKLLSKMGINVNLVAFARVDERIAYRIGGKEPGCPKILIEKDRFLPLLLTYRPSERSVPEMITVKFNYYRKMDQGWYPFEIIYSDGKNLREDYTIQTFQANEPIAPALFVMPRKRSGPDQASEQGQLSPEEERLRQIIKEFEEKY